MICIATRTIADRIKPLLLLLLCCTLAIIPSASLSEEQAPSTPPGETKSQRFITIDFDKVDILLFIKYISELTGKNFIIDKTVKGNVSIISPTKISEEEAYRVFESVLAVNGFTTVQAGPMIKIMPSVRARTENIDTLRHGERSDPEDRIVTQLIPLTHTTPAEMKKVLAPLVSKTSVVIAHTQSGILIVTDTLSNIQKLLSIIASLDVDYSSDELEVLTLENATASTLATTINAIFQRKAVPKKGASPSSGVKVVPYDRINALIVLAGPGDILRVKRLIALLDTIPERDVGNIQVVYLQHARAKELAAVLSNLPGQQTDPKAKKKAPAISKNVKIMPDEETNSLIITASRAEFKILENVIKKLDIPRRMVYIEALILEVDTDTVFDVGVKWIGAGAFADNTGAVLGGWGGSDGFSAADAVGDGSSAAAVGAGFTLGLLKQGIEIGGVTFPNIAAVLKAFQKNTSFNIIATPQLLTTDNKEARISVGENRPYQTSRSESISDNIAGFETFEYKDVATVLTITPQINQADTLRLEITTEVSKFSESATTNSDRPVTLKRLTETTVLVQDGDTIVIGGIIGHDAIESESKIPLLGDIPYLGWLFKNKNTTHLKTNMFIFITPHIIKNPADIARVTLVKEEQIDKVMPQVREELRRQVNLDHAMNLSDMGFQKLQAKQLGEARDYFDEALDINPDSPYALMNLGVICEEEGKIPDAIEYYQRVIDLGGDGETKGRGPLGKSLQQLCRENIKRLMQQKDISPDQEENDL